MSSPINPPHRYVPTLTEVVHVSDTTKEVSASVSEAAHIAASALRSNRLPERVPVTGQTAAQASSSAQVMEEEIIHRVLQRIDVSLDYRLRRCINDVMLEQTQLILTRLREDVEKVVRDSVHQAVADELATGNSSGPNLLKNVR